MSITTVHLISNTGAEMYIWAAQDDSPYLCTPRTSATNIPFALRVSYTGNAYFKTTLWIDYTADTTQGFSRSFKVNSFNLKGNCDNFNLGVNYTPAFDGPNCISYAGQTLFRKDFSYSRVSYYIEGQWYVFCEKPPTRMPTYATPNPTYPTPRPTYYIPPTPRPTYYVPPPSRPYTSAPFYNPPTTSMTPSPTVRRESEYTPTYGSYPTYYESSYCSTGCVIGAAVGGAFVFLLLIFIIVRVRSRKSKKEKAKNVTETQSNNQNPDPQNKPSSPDQKEPANQNQNSAKHDQTIPTAPAATAVDDSDESKVPVAEVIVAT